MHRHWYIHVIVYQIHLWCKALGKSVPARSLDQEGTAWCHVFNLTASEYWELRQNYQTYDFSKIKCRNIYSFKNRLGFEFRVTTVTKIRIGEDWDASGDWQLLLPFSLICWFWKFHHDSDPLPVAAYRWLWVPPHTWCPCSRCSETLMLSDRCEWKQQGIPALVRSYQMKCLKLLK